MDDMQVLCYEQLPRYTNLMKEYAKKFSKTLNIIGEHSIRSACAFNEQGTLALACVQLPIHIEKTQIIISSVKIYGSDVDYKDNFIIEMKEKEMGFTLSCSDEEIIKKVIGKMLEIEFSIT